MKRILIATFDMGIGGVERSLINLLEKFDFARYEVDLLLYRHQGEFLPMVPSTVRLLAEHPKYATFRKSIKETIRGKDYAIAIGRVLSKIHAAAIGKQRRLEEAGYIQMQYMWKYALPFLPEVNREYDVAISYLWPHEFVANKVKAKRKLAWIHTDYSTVHTDIDQDVRTWSKYDGIVAVSEACREAFLKKYGELSEKVQVIENVTSPEFILRMSEEEPCAPFSKDSRFKLVTVARLSHAKGIDRAIKALHLLREKGIENVAWYVVGDGGEEGMLRELIAGCGLQDDFILLGKRVNPYPYMKQCDLYVQPSRYEGKAVTVTEAKILGKPVLITNFPTAGSQVEHEWDGIICDAAPEGLADGIETIMQHAEIRDRLSRNCLSREYGNKEELRKVYALF